MKQFIRCTLAALVLTANPVSLSAQTTSLSEADQKELASYRLTMDTIKKVETATLTMIAEMKKDPRFQKLAQIDAELEALGKKEEPTDAEIERMTALAEQKEQLESTAELNLDLAGSLDALEASVKKTPILAKSIEQAGLTPREYAKTMMALIQASIAAGFKKAGMLKELPPGVNPENVTFVEEHEAELRAMQQQFEKMGG